MRAARAFTSTRPILGRPGTFAGRAVAFACFALLLMFNVALPALKVSGIPVRGLLAGGLLLFLSIIYADAVARALRRHGLIFYLTACLAALGTFVSFANGAQLDIIVQALIEVHLQVAVTMLVAAILAEVCGAGACAVAIIGTIAVTAGVALLQLFGLDAAWQMRDLLGNVQSLAVEDIEPFGRRRPTGLSYSAIQLATQLCLAFATYGAVRDKMRARASAGAANDPAILIALLLFLAASVASGTRSAILGGILFLVFYALSRRGSWVPVVVAAGGAAVVLAWPNIIAALQTTQPRVTSVDDGSAMGRVTLAYFGLRLFLDNPLGYGFGFKPFDHWAEYWDVLYQLPNAWHVQSRLLHNYLLSTLNIYGVGLLLVVPLVGKLLARGRSSLIFFIPYVVQITFHNAGPFWNDTIIWFVVATIAVARTEPALATNPMLSSFGSGRVREPPRRSGPGGVTALSGASRTPTIG